MRSIERCIRRVVVAASCAALCLLAGSASAGCPTETCGPGNVCGWIDCTPCNSGSFCARTTCHVIPGIQGCICQDGNCSTGSCAWCVSITSDSDCYTYAGCTGMVCPPYHCASASPTELAHAPCPRCETRGVPTNHATLRTDALITPTIPVEIAAFLMATENETGSFRVRNGGPSGIVALVTTITLVDRRGEERTFLNVTDSWSRDKAWIGVQAEADVPFSARADSPAGLSRIVVRPIFVLFEDGRYVGQDAETARACLRVRRVKTQVAIKAALDAYGAGGETALRNAIASHRPLLGWLDLVEHGLGLPGVVAGLTKSRHLEP